MKKMGSRFRTDAFDYTIKLGETMTAFEKLSRMADADMDIRLASLDNIVAIKVVGVKGGEVTFGVDGQTIMDLIAGKRFVGGFLLADKAQFESISEGSGHDDRG